MLKRFCEGYTKFEVSGFWDVTGKNTRCLSSPMSLDEIKEQKLKAEEARKKAEQDLEAVKTERAAAEEGL